MVEIEHITDRVSIESGGLNGEGQWSVLLRLDGGVVRRIPCDDRAEAIRLAMELQDSVSIEFLE